jgi:hypothetical protein
VLTVACCLWDANDGSRDFSTMYDETWVEKLYRGFARNLTLPFKFVCFTDHVRHFDEPIEQVGFKKLPPDYGSMIEPFQLNVPMILTGLDTVITGNIDHLMQYCFKADRLALPLDPNHPHTICNGVALVPRGCRDIYHRWNGETKYLSDMEWLRAQDYAVLDNLFPGQIISYKCHVKKNGLRDARIVYFHGKEKPHEIDEPFVDECWL